LYARGLRDAFGSAGACACAGHGAARRWCWCGFSGGRSDASGLAASGGTGTGTGRCGGSGTGSGTGSVTGAFAGALDGRHSRRIRVDQRCRASDQRYFGPTDGFARPPCRHEHSCPCAAAVADGAQRRTEHQRNRSGGWAECTRSTQPRRDRRRHPSGWPVGLLELGRSQGDQEHEDEGPFHGSSSPGAVLRTGSRDA